MPDGKPYKEWVTEGFQGFRGVSGQSEALNPRQETPSTRQHCGIEGALNWAPLRRDTPASRTPDAIYCSPARIRDQFLAGISVIGPCGGCSLSSWWRLDFGLSLETLGTIYCHDVRGIQCGASIWYRETLASGLKITDRVQLTELIYNKSSYDGQAIYPDCKVILPWLSERLVPLGMMGACSPETPRYHTDVLRVSLGWNPVNSFTPSESCTPDRCRSSTLRKIVFHFLSNWMGYDRGDSFPFDL